MKVLVNASARDTEREAVMSVKLVLTPVPLHNNEDKLASLVTTLPEDEDIRRTMTPETDSGIERSHLRVFHLQKLSRIPLRVLLLREIVHRGRTKKKKRKKVEPRRKASGEIATSIAYCSVSRPGLGETSQPENATIDGKTLANAAASITKREARIPVLAYILLRNDNGKLVPLVTTPTNDAHAELWTDRAVGSDEPSSLDGDEDAGMISSPSLSPSEVVEDPVSHSLPTRSSTSGRSKKGAKSLAPIERLPADCFSAHSRYLSCSGQYYERRSRNAHQACPRDPPTLQNKDKLASLGTTPPGDEDMGGTVKSPLNKRSFSGRLPVPSPPLPQTPETDSGTESIKPCCFDGDADTGTISSPSRPPFEVSEGPVSYSFPTRSSTLGSSKKTKEDGSHWTASGKLFEVIIRMTMVSDLVLKEDAELPSLPDRTLHHVAIPQEEYPALQGLAWTWPMRHITVSLRLHIFPYCGLLA
ncbi:hypothetical protein ACEPAF_5545 [Sanghuangporus sanghuang]